MRELAWAGEHDFTVEGVRYRWSVNAKLGPADPDQLVIIKNRRVIERYAELIARDAPRTILELGIYAGGSTALLAQLAAPDRLAALDHSPVRQPRLDAFIDAHRLGDVVRLHYGVDQADVEVLDRIVADDLGGGPIDLVVDDASHLEPQTRASFNRLFPHVRPGGAYVIEDWSWAHQIFAMADRAYQGVPPMSLLVIDLVMLAGGKPDIVADVTIDKQWALVRRGPAELDPETFDVGASLDKVGREMASALDGARSRQPRPPS